MKVKTTIPQYILASKTTRALNFLIDIIFIKITITILYVISGFIPFGEQYYSLLDWFDSFDDAQNFLLGSAVMFAYYLILEMAFARSIGKYFTKTIVVISDGSRPKPINILSRTLIRIFPLEYFSFLRGRKPGWHDEHSGTFVVKNSK